jgi:glutathione S-transferase
VWRRVTGLSTRWTLARREFLVGSSPTLADIALYAYTHVAPEGGFDLSGYPAIGAWLERVAAMPRHVPIEA